MPYPQIVEYNDAVQEPDKVFADLELKRGITELSPLGLPVARSGGFALTYSIECSGRRYAVRCFHREIPGVQERYAAISQHLRKLNSPYFVSFDFQRDGILVRGTRYPIVKMDWVAGDTLGMFLERHYANRTKLRELKDRFFSLSRFLEQEGIGHGDIQNENVIVEPSGIRLIDYDGMFVPGLPSSKGTEVGHKHFQHPARSAVHFGPKMDRFASIVVDVSLDALDAQPALHSKYSEGGQAIIFKANDFQSPGSSDVFRELKKSAHLRTAVERLEAICLSNFSGIPDLSDFREGKNIPTPSISLSAPSIESVEVGYIGAFDVLDATRYQAVMARVGDKVELVGQVVSVKVGRTRRGKPYVFVNFGEWRGNSVKLTIWSEGLEAMSKAPDETWIGKWLSVTGLIEPPYAGRAGRQSYQSVGITITSQSQIMTIAASEAKFRLGAKRKRTPAATTRPGNGNKEILSGLPGNKPNNRAGAGTTRSPTNAVNRQSTQGSNSKITGGPKTSNQQLLDQLRSSSPKGGAAHPSPPPPKPPNQQPARRGNSGAIWFWIIVAAMVLYGMSR